MTETKDLLFEIGVEELPPKLIKNLSLQLANNLCAQFQTAKLSFGKVEHFSSPRRLAVLIGDLALGQKDYEGEKKGPALKAAYDDKGQPTKAALGFARSCGVGMEALQTKKINNGEFLVYRYLVEGKTTASLLEDFCTQAIKKLPIPKPMRWGANSYEFIRPIHWLVLLLGNEIIDAEIFATKTSNQTFGHRFHHPQGIQIKHADNYESELKKRGMVIVNFQERRKNIHDQITEIANEINAIAVINENLLDEVTGLVEWPVALLANFDKDYLNIPEEALISAMQTHQKAFHLIDKKGKLLPHFIAIANIKSKKPQQVISGNERVMHARLADAAFFYKTDCKHSLESRLDRLKGIIFQTKLGNLYERAQRLSETASFIAQQLKLDSAIAARAGLLAKTDLVSDMVEEFPELQGIMGYYYALNDNLSEAIAMGIRGQYMPRFAGDVLPQSDYGCVVSLADRLDKLIGIFGINQQPTGEKDPFALRRAALGALHIIIEKRFNLDLTQLIEKAIDNYKGILINPNVATEVISFFNDRLRYWYQDQGISVDIFNAVNARNITTPYDFHLRVNAVKAFRALPEAQALAAANKRVSNILTKESIDEDFDNVNIKLFELDAEKELGSLLAEKQKNLKPLFKDNSYTEILSDLANLQKPVDRFFDDVMVMVEDKKIRNNRLALLVNLRKLFLEVADISKLQG